MIFHFPSHIQSAVSAKQSAFPNRGRGDVKKEGRGALVGLESLSCLLELCGYAACWFRLSLCLTSSRSCLALREKKKVIQGENGHIIPLLLCHVPHPSRPQSYTAASSMLKTIITTSPLTEFARVIIYPVAETFASSNEGDVGLSLRVKEAAWRCHEK
ncbi:hypothetical protein B0F90DRAFT_1741129 [Multifurca ochricompacta]|uniref:Uncharacterized protein n=1 Tax=Multifurca ochricompacta TaxID=376703 RepID=A0AAD4M1P7_9AGAM|nr:hypothetical protein B0F90DRAFT_1741129 [Multifurca ochricompacta]